MKTPLAVLVLLLAAIPAWGRVSVGVFVGRGYGYYPAPPPPPAYVYVPPCPAPGYVWVPGYWYSTGPRHHWRSGYWMPPRYYFDRGRHRGRHERGYGGRYGEYRFRRGGYGYR